MSLPIIILEDARAELHEAILWYEEQREGLGSRFKNAVFSTLDRIAAHPRLFAITTRKMRAAPVDDFPSYRVYYRVRRAHAEIVSVFHASRDPQRWRRRS